MRRRRILESLAVALAIAGVCAPAAGAAPSASRCVQRGLEPIPITVRAGARYREGVGTPEYEVRGKGVPLPSRCDALRTVAIQVTVWFPHLRFAFLEGFPIPWQEVWNGRRAVHGELEDQFSNASFRGLECPYKARARLRYEVIATDGLILGRRVVQVPVEPLPCPRSHPLRGSSQESLRALSGVRPSLVA